MKYEYFTVYILFYCLQKINHLQVVVYTAMHTYICYYAKIQSSTDKLHR